MEIDLNLIGMNRGKQYETIITTANCENVQNAAPIGVLCSGKDTILCRIFKGGKTLNNIISQREFTVNITHDPELFTLSTIGNLSQEYFSDPIRKNGEANVIKSKVTDMVINKEVQAFNRAFSCLIETLANFTRFDLVDEEKKRYYLTRFRECSRVVNKVGGKEEKQSMGEIKKELIKRGYEI